MIGAGGAQFVEGEEAKKLLEAAETGHAQPTPGNLRLRIAIGAAMLEVEGDPVRALVAYEQFLDHLVRQPEAVRGESGVDTMTDGERLARGIFEEENSRLG